ncbi:MAG TPA: autotransporter-associated beta strand repeat-containing protein [Tepidisphaeraceae bacterium]|nr:autotransporter-associated beta strand repeat-containing protein [Tepidisphaeraceae bacterium]
MTRSQRIKLAAAVGVALCGSMAYAQQASEWRGFGADGNWSTAANWDVVPDGGEDLLLFGNAYVTSAGTRLTANNSLAGYNGHRIEFQDTSLATDPASVITGNALTLTGAAAGAPGIRNLSTSLQTFNLSGTLTLDQGAAAGADIDPVNGDLTFSATTPIALATGTELRVGGGNGKSVTFNGIISGPGNGVRIGQNSVVVFGAANAYSGDTLVHAGTLRFAATGSAASSTLRLGDTTGAAPATITIDDTNGGTNIASPIVVQAGSAGLKTLSANNTSNTNTYSGNLTLDADLTVSVTSGGTLALTGTTIDLKNNRLTVDAAGTTAVSQALTNSTGAGKLTKAGAGLLTLSGANSIAGGITINGGRLRLTNGTANTLAGGILVNTGGTLELSVAGADNTVFNNMLGAASNTVTLNGGTVLANFNTDRTATGRNVVVQAGGGTFDMAGTFSGFVEAAYTQVRFTTGTLSGSGTVTKNGGGRLQFQGANASFTGPVIVNNGTLEASGSSLGNASGTNTITINGGNLAMSGTLTQPTVSLAGGALSATGAARVVNGTVNVTASSFLFLNDFWRDNGGANGITLGAQLTGSGALGIALNRSGYDANSGIVSLKSTTNNYSGTITVGKNLKLENSATAGAGKTLGTAAVALADGGLLLRDNGTGSGQVLAYGNNVSVIAPTGLFAGGDLPGTATIDANRAGGSNAGNTFRLGNLAIGARTLNITGGNGYGVEFAGDTTLTGNATFSPTTAPLTLEDVVEGTAGLGMQKLGAGDLFIKGIASYTGPTQVGAGALLLHPAASITTSIVTVQDDGRIGGEGTVDGTIRVRSGGTIAPGGLSAADPIGTIVASAVDFSNGAVAVQLNGAGAAGAAYDQLEVTGTDTDVPLSGAVGLTVELNYVPEYGDQFTIVELLGTGEVLGQFAGRAEGLAMPAVSSANGQSYGLQIDYHGGSGGNDIVLTVVPVPEPGTFGVAAASALVALARRTRRSRRG